MFGARFNSFICHALLATPYILYAGGYVYWAPDGVLLSNRYAYTSDIVSDGKGSAIVILNAGSSIGAQRVDENGNLLWGIDGAVVTNDAELVCGGAQAISDGEGGVIVVWERLSSSSLT